MFGPFTCLFFTTILMVNRVKCNQIYIRCQTAKLTIHRPPFKCWLALAIINANKSSHLTHKTPIGELLPVPLGSPFFFFLASAQFQLLLKCQRRWGMCKNNYGNPLDDRCKGGKYRCVCEWEAGMGTRKHLNVLKPIFAIQLKCCICQSTLD